MKRGLSIVSALGLGAGLMYLLDPDRGARRRKTMRKQMNRAMKRANLEELSSDLVERARELGEAGERVRELAGELGRDFGKRARALSGRRRGWGKSGRGAGARALEAASHYGSSGGDRIRSVIDDLRTRLEVGRGGESRSSTGRYALFGVGLGALLVYFFATERGSTRRSELRETLSRTWRQARGRFEEARQTSGWVRNLADRAREVFRPTREEGMGEEQIPDGVLRSNIRAALGEVLENPRAVQVRVRHGRVRLSGQVPSDRLQDVLQNISEVRGVLALENELVGRQIMNGEAENRRM